MSPSSRIPRSRSPKSRPSEGRDGHLRSVPRTPPIAEIAALLRGAWDRGWQPLDLARVIGTGGPNPSRALAILTDCVSLDRLGWHARAGACWREQADAMGAADPWWEAGRPYWLQFQRRHDIPSWMVEQAATVVIGLLESLPAQPVLEAPPHRPGWWNDATEADNGILAKVRGLLAKAESTQFEHEAEAFTAKAQELIARHSLDVALLAADVDVPGGRRVYLDPPYAKAKFLLLANIAEANSCRACWNDHRKTATLIGHRTDLHLAEVLFTSLLLQGTGAVVAAGASSDGWGTNTTRSWRNAFWHGFADRIGQRLREATATVHARHRAETGEDLLPVLADRSAAVDDAFAESFPNLGSFRTSISNSEGVLAGRDFADTAELDSSRTVARTRPRELGL